MLITHAGANASGKQRARPKRTAPPDVMSSADATTPNLSRAVSVFSGHVGLDKPQSAESSSVTSAHKS